MRSLVVATIAVGILGVTAFVQTNGSGLEKKILDLEKQRIAAMVKKDIATLDALLAWQGTRVQSEPRFVS